MQNENHNNPVRYLVVVLLRAKLVMTVYSAPL